MTGGVDEEYAGNFDLEIKPSQKGPTDLDDGLCRDETGSNPLSDLARFSSSYGGASDLVEKSRLPMVHVAKNHCNW